MQGESDGWYCAARREITRATSEGSSRSRGRAALAELRKQENPTGLPGVSADVAWRADGIWKARRGCFGGGLQGGPRRGRSPITGPALPHAAQAAKITNKEKALAHAGRQKTYLKEQALSHPSLLQRKAAQCIGAPPQGGKIPIPKGKPSLFQSLRITQYCPPRGGPPPPQRRPL